MRVKEGVSLQGLHPVMRPVLKTLERIWKEHGHPEGVTITSTTEGIHSAGSWHYYGFAVDVRTVYESVRRPGPNIDTKKVAIELRNELLTYDVVVYDSHIHIEIGDILAYQLGVMFD